MPGCSHRIRSQAARTQGTLLLGNSNRRSHQGNHNNHIESLLVRKDVPAPGTHFSFYSCFELQLYVTAQAADRGVRRMRRDCFDCPDVRGGSALARAKVHAPRAARGDEEGCRPERSEGACTHCGNPRQRSLSRTCAVAARLSVRVSLRSSAAAVCICRASALQLPKPDIAEADRRTGITVRLEHDWRAVVRRVLGNGVVFRRALELEAVLHQDAVVKRRHARRRLE
jgi:hypothetical protein